MAPSPDPTYLGWVGGEAQCRRTIGCNLQTPRLPRTRRGLCLKCVVGEGCPPLTYESRCAKAAPLLLTPLRYETQTQTQTSPFPCSACSATPPRMRSRTPLEAPCSIVLSGPTEKIDVTCIHIMLLAKRKSDGISIRPKAVATPVYLNSQARGVAGDRCRPKPRREGRSLHAYRSDQLANSLHPNRPSTAGRRNPQRATLVSTCSGERRLLLLDFRRGCVQLVPAYP